MKVTMLWSISDLNFNFNFTSISSVTSVISNTVSTTLLIATTSVVGSDNWSSAIHSISVQLRVK